MSIYVEIEMHAAMAELWEKTQVPELHQRWDLRFTRIEYLPREDESQPQSFLYSTRIGFGLNIAGEGTTVGSRDAKNGSRTSALKFWSDDPKSLIREGSGYWKYVPDDGRVKFLTWYDYSTRFGVIGRFFDAVIFRPLMGWATAWSFDRLRLWLEKNIDPALSLQRSMIYAVSRVVLAFVWIYHGLVPKLVFQHPDEIAILIDSGTEPANAVSLLNVIGWAEIAIGLSLLIAWRVRFLLLVNIALMLFALVVVAAYSPQHLFAAFNPVTLNVLMMALAWIGFVAGKDVPSSSRCKRKKSEPES